MKESDWIIVAVVSLPLGFLSFVVGIVWLLE